MASTIDELNYYSKKHLTCKSATALNEHRYTRDHLAEFFGKDRRLHTITTAEGRQFMAFLKETLAESTAGKRCEKAKGYFRTAVENNWLQKNPLEEVSTSAKAPRDRDVDISQADSNRILQEIVDPKFALVYALARYGGLRTPSEPNVIELDHIRWDDHQIHIHAPKTGLRTIPIFAEIRPHLLEVCEMAEVGQVRLLGDWEPTNAALTNRLCRILKRLGMDRYPKPWQNLRTTRENELKELYPRHVVHAWIGHTEDTAREFYDRVSKEHYLTASSPEAEVEANTPKAKQNPKAHRATPTSLSDEKTVQNGVSKRTERI